MSNIEPNIIDPGGQPSPPPDVIVPDIDPEGDGIGNDEIREPDADTPPFEPDPEEGGRDLPPIHRAIAQF
ncbi:hypothetical protein ASG43_07980 [Aureimonas sp. Leaf454]|uniref:hypothetical protein n=1 Tax=Aureimonas sp. Leaf454 TaxID=1736381 RepID=UPI0006F92900|nr:hypothetical protein [Aureimonas sp. Leaf454]KQT48781.1 hypothetical protein ASG43_07980 [Aureimonas sp. Leaf454]